MRLKTWRKLKGWTQTELGKAAGRSKSLISGIESGAVVATTDLAIDLDRLTGGKVTVAELRPDLHDVRVVPQSTGSQGSGSQSAASPGREHAHA